VYTRICILCCNFSPLSLTCGPHLSSSSWSSCRPWSPLSRSSVRPASAVVASAEPPQCGSPPRPRFPLSSGPHREVVASPLRITRHNRSEEIGHGAAAVGSGSGGRELSHLFFPKKTKCITICMPRSSFMHLVTNKCIQKQYHVRKKVDYQRLRLILEIKAPNITDSRLGLRTPRTSKIITRLQSSFVTPDFPKKTKCKPICMPGSSFMHIVTYKWIQKQYHVWKRKIIRDLRLNPRNEGSKHHRPSTGGCVRLAPATSSQDFKVTSSFWATLFIARVSTCRTQQVWGKE
jgi:hypothetical protein